MARLYEVEGQVAVTDVGDGGKGRLYEVEVAAASQSPPSADLYEVEVQFIVLASSGTPSSGPQGTTDLQGMPLTRQPTLQGRGSFQGA